MWLKPKEAEKHLSDLPGSNTPVIFNINQTGFYRCNLSLLPRNFIAIFLVMETWVLGPAERVSPDDGDLAVWGQHRPGHANAAPPGQGGHIT